MIVESLYQDTSNSRGLRVSVIGANMSPATPFTASTLVWTEVTASTAADYGGLRYHVAKDLNVSSVLGMVFIATGAASSETIVASLPINIDYRSGGHGGFLPVSIPAGTRVSVAACSSSTNSWDIHLAGVTNTSFNSVGAPPGTTIVDSGPYGFTSHWGNPIAHASPFFAVLDPGTSANTWSSWQEISKTATGDPAANLLNGDELDFAYDYLGVMLGTPTNTSTSITDWLVELAYGAASSETPFAQLAISTSSLGIAAHNGIEWMPWGRAAGDRISARAMCTNTDNTDRLLMCTLFGAR